MKKNPIGKDVKEFHNSIIELIKNIAYRKGLGGLLAEGVRRAAERIGGGAEKYAMHVKGLELPRYTHGI